MTMGLEMQSVLDSLCRCFGSPVNATDLHQFDDPQPHSNTQNKVSTTSSVTPQQQQRQPSPSSQQQPAPTTPDAKRRTKTIKLQEEQWDALFDCNAASHAVAGGHCGSVSPTEASVVGGSTSNRKPPTAPKRDDMTVEQAQAVAKAKLAANGGGAATASAVTGTSGSNKIASPSSQPARRKRAQPEDIFRSKKNAEKAAQQGPSSNNNTNARSTKDAFSRFLTNNPVLANSLCFATPIRDSAEEAEANVSAQDVKDCNSVVSDTNTLNTAEDTITSTLYYEQVKLAGLKQKNPPMPLFGAYEVKPSDDIHKVATSDDYSSALMKDWVQQNPEMLKVEPLESEKTASVVDSPRIVSNKNRSNKKKSREQDDDDIPPDMVNSSSDSTGRSV